MKKKILSALLVGAMVSSLLAGCGGSDSASTSDNSTSAGSSDAQTTEQGSSDATAEASGIEGKTVAFIPKLTGNAFFEVANDGAQEYAEKWGITVDYMGSSNAAVADQVSVINQAISSGVDAICISTVDAAGVSDALQEAKDAGIPVIIVDRMVDVSDDSLYTTWIGTDALCEGRKAAEWLNGFAEAKGIAASDIHIADIQGTIGSTAQIGRTKGLEEGVDKYGWDLVAQQTGEFTQAKGQEVMESMLKQYDNINVVYCENDNEAFGAIDAIEAAGKTVGSDIANGEIMVISFDTTHAGLQDVLDGKIECDVECNPLHGPRAEELIKKLEAGEDVDKQNYVDEEIFAHDDTVKSVKATNSLDEEKDFDVTPLTQDILDKRAY